MKQIISIEGLADWLRGQDPKKEYEYGNVRGCLIFEFLKSRGLPVKSVGGWIWRDTNDITHDLPGVVDNQIYRDGSRCPMSWVATCQPHTIGAALERCEEVLK